MDVLTRMLQKAERQHLIKGLGCDLVPQGVASLQYADDTILLLDKNIGKAKNLKNVLSCFELMSGMRINYDKSEMVPMNLEDQEVENLKEVFGCPVGTFPIKYLGIPLHYQKLRREDLQPLIDKIIKRAAGWKGKLLFYICRPLSLDQNLFGKCAYLPVVFL